ncbi:MAG: lipoyl synthase [Oligoflexia bacterium]|nr:lipoyl synthase [Oligoflexia bacterium]
MKSLTTKKKIRLSELHSLKTELRKAGLNTVCESARCPNISECFAKRTATFLIMGDICTRNCKFCNIATGNPLPLDANEPEKLADLALKMKLMHIVITSVTRDDLPDHGAGHFAETITALKNKITGSKIEVLTPDFMGRNELLDIVFSAGPDIFNHNIETTEKLSAVIRPAASYTRSLNVLKYASGKAEHVKSGFMLGLGENDDQIARTIRDLNNCGVNILTIGQYFRPSASASEVVKIYSDDEFDYWYNYSKSLGFTHVFSGAYVRSSYMAGEILKNPPVSGKTGSTPGSEH